MALRLLLAGVGGLLASAAGMAQTPQKTPAMPPIRMGLWESTMTNGPGAGHGARTCITPQSYEKALASMPAGCTLSNQVRDAHHISADIECALPNVHETGHLDTEIPDPETTHTVINVNLQVQGGQSMPLTLKIDGHFVSADCGSLAPGKAEPVR